MINIKRIVCTSCEENCYLIDDGKVGILFDPGSDSDKILRVIEKLEIPYIFLTHCHYDHIESVEAVKKAKNSKVVATAECSKNITDSKKNVSLFFGNAISLEPAEIILDDTDILKTALGKILCIKTPGHTECSACFMIENNLFSGDTLFKLTVGRWDLPTGDERTLKKSIKEKLYTLDDKTRVFPGHGEPTTIEYEKKHNLFLKADK